MKKVLEYPVILLIGGIGYGLIELMFRGRTHWSMLIAGAVCFSLLYAMSNYMNEPRPHLWIMGAAVITAVEFVCGAIVNVRLGWNVWDYSAHFANLYGQICLLFTFFWFLLSIPAVELCKLLGRVFRNV